MCKVPTFCECYDEEVSEASTFDVYVFPILTCRDYANISWLYKSVDFGLELVPDSVHGTDYLDLVPQREKHAKKHNLRRIYDLHNPRTHHGRE